MNITEVWTQLQVISLSVLPVCTLVSCSTLLCALHSTAQHPNCILQTILIPVLLLLEIRRERITAHSSSNDQFTTLSNGTTDAKFKSWSDPTEENIAQYMFERRWVGSGYLIDATREISQSCNLKCESFKYSICWYLSCSSCRWNEKANTGMS